MKLKLLLWPLGIFLTGVLVAFATTLFLTVSFEDVLLKKKQIHAGHLNAPWPGKAYAYYKPTGQFVSTPLCSKEQTEVSISKLPETVEAHNKLGLQFAQAMAYVTGTLGVSGDGGFEVKAVSLVMPFEKQFSTTSQTAYLEYCLQDVVDTAAHPDYLVLMVTNVYFAENESTGLPEGKMVGFNPKPITFNYCDPAANAADCDFEQVSVDYYDARWVTRVKDFLDLISIS
ncbi:hypothetical protein [Litoreibacter arenae]|uniref:Uncharacterized protein n=1 Tax=Litoreibacter arenae DSM 19593 TaxID=1123360 RepID=S9QLV1_9RHOB|nr:hypothetical protein [Litoreibacter arenae]EPX80722.1 hypothetical protein thalar_00942 [Litoreibacter arenae DSM 19593]